MGRVLTNNVQLSYSLESSLGLADGNWTEIEPNAINTFGATITTVARDPISQNRQRRKGTVTDLDSAVEFETDLTISEYRNFLGGNAFVVGINSDIVQLLSTGTTTADDAYNGLPFLSSGQAAKFDVGTLIYVTGGSNSANNGLKQVDANIAAGSPSITVAENLVDETASFRVSFAGYRIAAGVAPTWTWDSVARQATLAASGVGTALEARGLFPGQRTHIGSIASLGGSIQNGFENTAANDMIGYADVVSIAADSVVFEKVALALQFTDDPGPSTDVDVIFGEFYRNVPVSDSDYVEQSFQMEAAFPNLGDGTAGSTVEAYQYARGNFSNTLIANFPLTDKATITATFVGTDTDNPTTSRQAGFTAVAAGGVLTLSGNAADTETVTIGTVTYTFQTTLTDTANNVLIGASAAASIANLVAAITAGAGAGTNYGTGTVANPFATAAVGASDTMTVTASATGVNGNTIPTTETLSNGSFAAATLSGGSNGLNRPNQTAAFSTTIDFGRLRILEVDEDGLTTDFKSITITLNNNATPEKVLGQLGARFINTGNYEIDIEAQLIFSNPLVINAIRNNETLTLDFEVKNDDGVITFNIPSLTLGGGDREFPVNETVLINATAQAFADPTLNTSLGIGIIHVPLP